jgi:hypothetical protein
VHWIAVAKNGSFKAIDKGWGEAVSPVADRLAWILEGKIYEASFDGSGRTVIAASPRWLGVIPEPPSGHLTWSPDGKQILFFVPVSETCRDEIHLLDVETGHDKRFLQHTCLNILAWRSSK